ncbi:DUF5997 family protein [Micromonospora sp. NPDC004551]|uniref:DUF5997 family protein n=1 Tax=Micromonospora sp. NPDC004551 TaxID=3154284 RepID=UPI0033B0C7C3
MTTKATKPADVHPREVAKRLGVSRGMLRRCGQDFSRTVEQIADLLSEKPQWLIDGQAATAARKQQQRNAAALRESHHHQESDRAQRMLWAYKDGHAG